MAVAIFGKAKERIGEVAPEQRDAGAKKVMKAATRPSPKRRCKAQKTATPNRTKKHATMASRYAFGRAVLVAQIANAG